MVQINRGKNHWKPESARRTPIIAGNWKMNMTVEETLALVDEMIDDLDAYDEVETVICPPFIALYAALDLLEDTSIKLGAQNMNYNDSGAFTGEVSPLMLREVCDYVIIGHSERRMYFQETDEAVNLKVKAALKHDLAPIVAVGEDQAQRESGHTTEFITHQVQVALQGVNAADATGVVIAYEPLWAIGTGQAATPELAQAVAAMIRQVLSSMFSVEIAGLMRIQYGGSVTGDNIADFMRQPDIDGALVGGASLKAVEFVKIVARTHEVNAKLK